MNAMFSVSDDCAPATCDRKVVAGSPSIRDTNSRLVRSIALMMEPSFPVLLVWRPLCQKSRNMSEAECNRCADDIDRAAAHDRPPPRRAGPAVWHAANSDCGASRIDVLRPCKADSPQGDPAVLNQYTVYY